MPQDALSNFLTRWNAAGGAERANYQSFLIELCDLLQVPRPNPTTPDDTKNNYVFDRAITSTNPDGTTAPNFIDLYYRAHFVLETKQGIERNAGIPAGNPSAPLPSSKPKKLKKGHGTRNTPLWNDALLRAKAQAEAYVRNIPDDNPPFLLVVDVGYQIETYADFSGLGKTYTPFPDNLSHRFKLTDLADPKRGPDLIDRLKKIWADPHSLNPAKRSAKVTREIAAALAELSKSLEKTGHHPESVAHFLMRVLFTLFAEDVHLIPNNAFTKLLEDLKDTPEKFAPMAMAVWQNMDKGGFSPVLREDLLRFNGGLFADTQALPLTGNQLELLINAAHQDWSDVEPAIFGTLLERALDTNERHKLGAHYTPRAYVERLVLPTVIEPLRKQWQTAKTTAIDHANNGDLKKAIKTVGEFLKTLCNTTVLDPACGSGNFLYVTLEHMKRLEGEVYDFLAQFPNTQLPLEYTGLTVDPHNLRGIEINPRAAAITDLVLWIGYLQWHFRTHGKTMPAEPVLKKFDNIENRDAVLAYDNKELARDEYGKPLSRWDGITFKKHPATGDKVPDDRARIPVYKYTNPRMAHWPVANYVVGNPPYIGARRIRQALGDAYVDTLRSVYPDVPDTADLVMYWWYKAVRLLETRKIRRSGLITTNSIVQAYSRVLIESHMSGDDPIAFAFAIPDHPWVEASDGAQVRVAMTVTVRKDELPAGARLLTIIDEDGEATQFHEVSVRSISAALKPTAAVSVVEILASNRGVCFQGVVPAGDGFKLEPDDLSQFGFKRNRLPPVIRPYIIGRDIVQRRQEKFIIDLFGLNELEARRKWPTLYQHLYDRVYPDRQQNNRASYKEKWWLFAEPRPAMRKALAGLTRFIVTPYTAKFRPFVFIDQETIPDAMAYAIASDDAYSLGVLSSRVHVLWALTSGGRMGVGNDPRYTSDQTFSPFPFPDSTEKQKQRIRDIAEELDAHRKRQQAKYPDLTLTDMYNVLEKLRAAEGGDGIANLPICSQVVLTPPSAIRQRATSRTGNP